MFRIARRLFILLALTLVAATPTFARAAADGDPFSDEWAIECVDCVHSFPELSPHSAAVGPDGALHAVYGRDGLYHLTYRDGAWAVEAIDGAGTGLHPPVMTLDGDGRVHALYAVGDAGGLHYARQTAGGWALEPLPFFAGPQPAYALAVGDDGAAQISFYDSVRGRLNYAVQQGEAWQVSAVDATRLAGAAHALTLDPAGRPALCYKVENGILRVARRSAAGWQIEDVPSDHGADGQACDLAFAPDGALHVAHVAWNGLPYYVLHSLRGPAGWTTELVAEDAPSPNLQRYTVSLQIDPAGAPHLTYNSLEHLGDGFPNYTNSSQRYASRGPAGWHMVTLDADNARDGTLVLDGDAPVVVYRAAAGLALASPAGDDVSLTPLDRAGDVGFGPAIALNGSQLRVTYFDRENFAVRYAARGLNGWALDTVDRQPAGRFASDFTDLALGPGGEPHVLYDFIPLNYFDQPGAFNYAHRVGESWALDELRAVGGPPYALAVDARGQAHVALAGQTGQLAYTPWPPVLPLEIVDEAVGGERMGLAVDAEGGVHLAFASPLGVRYARRAPGGGWTVETVDADPGQGMSAEAVSLALDGAGRPHLAYNSTDPHTGYIFHAERAADGAWIVTSTGLGGRFPSLAVDERGGVHISFYEESESGLWYAYRAVPDGIWARRSVLYLQESRISPESALAVDAAGNPAILYRDADTGDAMLAYFPPTPLPAVFLPVIGQFRATQYE